MGWVELHAVALEAAATKLEADGIGSVDPAGHARVLRAMVADMGAAATRGEVPVRFYTAAMIAGRPHG
jgi:hypothetical protein